MEDNRIPPEVDPEDIVYDDDGTPVGWMVPSPKGGRLFRTWPGGAHPNHRPGPGMTRKSVRERLLNLTGAATKALEEAMDRGLVCAACGKVMPDRVTVQRALAIVDKGGKYSIGKPTDDDEGKPLATSIVMLPPLAQGGGS